MIKSLCGIPSPPVFYLEVIYRLETLHFNQVSYLPVEIELVKQGSVPPVGFISL